jgi:tetratricopeptide (TPR) repeat protein
MKKDRAKPAASAAPPYDYDVFISYSSKDQVWVKGELLKRVEQAGLRAFIDFRDFTPGAPSIREMERGVIKCRKTLLIFTPDYVESEWCELESLMGQTLSPANRDLRMIPLLKTPCEKPLRIAPFNHIDFTDTANVDLAWLQLLTALGKAPEPRQLVPPSREQWFLPHPYAMPPNFTGRLAERNMLSDWLTSDDTHPLLVLRALGGFGKSALTWHWLLHDVLPAEFPRVVWWSFYEGDASFESFVASTVRYLDHASESSASPREQLVALLKALHSNGILLILDGFERALRAFGGLNAAYMGDEAVEAKGGECDCLSPLADTFLRSVIASPGIRGKVLLTTRLRPSSVGARDGILLQGCREEELVQLHPADAVQFFLAQGIRGGRAEIESACEPYGYHPLSLRLLAGLIVSDLQQQGDIAAARRLDVSGDLVQRQHHVLKQAYESLGLARQKLLSRIACFRGSVSYAALKVISEIESPKPHASTVGGERGLDADLRDLVARGLLHRDLGKNRFDLHPIVRSYAYDRLEAPERAGSHARLRDYFAAVPKPDDVHNLDDLAPLVELYHHTVRAGEYDKACVLFREHLSDVTFFQLGAYQLRIDLLRGLFPDGEDGPPRLRDERDQGWTLNELAKSYNVSGQPGRVVPLAKREIALHKKHNHKINLSIALGSLAYVQTGLGAFRAAEANLRRRIGLCLEMKEEYTESIGHLHLGRLLAYCGAWAYSDTELATALEIAAKVGHVQAEGIAWSDRSLFRLLQLRCEIGGDLWASGIGDAKPAIASARRALDLADETANDGRFVYPVRDYVRAHWLLGSANRVAGELNEAERHLHDALERCRRTNMVDHEANILIDLARLRVATSAPDEAQRLAEEALIITERSGYVLQGADAHLVLSQLAKDRGDATTLRHHSTEALRLATCDGPPDYTYKAAYDEATALLR